VGVQLLPLLLLLLLPALLVGLLLLLLLLVRLWVRLRVRLLSLRLLLLLLGQGLQVECLHQRHCALLPHTTRIQPQLSQAPKVPTQGTAFFGVKHWRCSGNCLRIKHQWQKGQEGGLEALKCSRYGPGSKN